MEYQKDDSNLSYRDTNDKINVIFNQFRSLLRKHKQEYKTMKKIVRKHVGDSKFNEIMNDYNKEIQKVR